jgi:hypothetical protein
LCLLRRRLKQPHVPHDYRQRMTFDFFPSLSVEGGLPGR